MGNGKRPDIFLDQFSDIPADSLRVKERQEKR